MQQPARGFRCSAVLVSIFRQAIAAVHFTSRQARALHFIAPGKPTQNGNIESLNGKIRDELFNMESVHDDL
jgi:transposase InsO family protein